MSKVLVIIITLKPQDIFQMKLEPYIILLSFFFLLKQTDFYFVCNFESTSEIASSWQKTLPARQYLRTLAKTLFLKHHNLTNHTAAKSPKKQPFFYAQLCLTKNQEKMKLFCLKKICYFMKFLLKLQIAEKISIQSSIFRYKKCHISFHN